MTSYIEAISTTQARMFIARVEADLQVAIEANDTNRIASLRELINQFYATEVNGVAGIPMAVMN